MVLAQRYWYRLNQFARTKIAKISVEQVNGPVFLRLGLTDWFVFLQVFVDCEYRLPSAIHASALSRLYKYLIESHKTPVIIDCGANVGLSALWFANEFPAARVIAIEPEPSNYALLKLNASTRDNITPICGAISDRKVNFELKNESTSHWAWKIAELSGGEFETSTIEELLSSVPDAVLMVVKIDIEGGEINLFRSNLKWVNDTPLIIFEPHDAMLPWQGSSHAIYSALVHTPRDYLGGGENVFAFSHSLRNISSGSRIVAWH